MRLEHLIRDPLPGYLDAEPAIPCGNIVECLNVPAMLHQKYQLDLFFVGPSQLSPEPARILAIEILSSAGRVEVVPEKLMDCVTAVSGSGPAFVFMFIEALADAAVRCGMPRAQAYTYAAQTVYGSAGMVLESGKHPAVLKDMVCSPAGTTIEGVAALEKNNFRNAVIEAVTAACDRSIVLGK